MGNNVRSYISINHHAMGVSAVRTLHATDIQTKNIDTQNLIVNGTNITEALQSDGSLSVDSINSNNITSSSITTNSAGVTLAYGSINDNIVSFNLNDVTLNYPYSPILNTSASSNIGLISVSLISNDKSAGSMALYTKGKMLNLIKVYTIIFESNSNTNSKVSLNTQSGILTISTSKNVNFEIKALNLFEQ